MIYIIEDEKNIENICNEIKDEYKKSMKIYLFCHKDIVGIIEGNIIKNDKVKELINIYIYNVKLGINGYEKIFNEDLLSKRENFLCEFKEFNYKQYEATLLARDYNLLINAGAGTGKTTTAVEAVLNILLDKKANPDEVLMMTFTNTSTDDMYKKIYNELQKRYLLTYNERCLYLIENINKIRICTIHNYLKSVIEQVGFIDGYSKNVTFGVSMEKLKQFIDTQVDYRFEGRKINYDDYKMYDRELKELIYKIITDSNINMSSIEDYMIYDYDKDEEFIKNVNDILVDTCNQVNKKFMENLIADDKILLNDLEYRLKNILKYNFKFNKILKNYKYIFIDECQDTSLHQFEVIFNIVSIINSKIFAVGDTMQAIYRFRSADPKSMNRFEKKTDKFIKLTKNYRTDESILNPINKAFKKLDKNYNILEPMKASNEEGIVIEKYSNEANKIDNIVKIINNNEVRIENLRAKNENDNDKNRIAILTRTNKEAEAIYNKLRDYDIKCTLASGGELFKTKAAKDLLALVRAILYKNSYVAKVQLMNSDYIKSKLDIKSNELLTEYDYKMIIDEYTKGIINKFDICYKCPEKKICTINCEERKVQNQKTVFSIMTDLIGEIEVRDEESKVYKENILIVLEELIKNNCISTLSDMEQFLDMQLTSNNGVKSSEERNNTDKVIISTFHSTKGLEFDTVIVLTDYDYLKTLGTRTEILIGSDNVKLSSYIENDIEVKKIGLHFKNKKTSFNNFYYTELNDLEKSKIYKDEVNLLYVALTRSMNKLYILHPNKIKQNTHASILKDGGFLK